jgi:hypothetical protein
MRQNEEGAHKGRPYISRRRGQRTLFRKPQKVLPEAQKQKVRASQKPNSIKNKKYPKPQ